MHLFYRPECQAQVLNFSGAKFHKFSTETEAVQFINEHGKSDFVHKSQHGHMQESGKNVSQQLIMNATNVIESAPSISEVTNMSSLTLKRDALKQRLSVLQKRFEDSMKELRTEIDAVGEHIETFYTKVNVPSGDEEYVTEEFKALQDHFSQLEKHYRDSVTELRAEISNLQLEVRALGTKEGQVKTYSEKGASAGSNAQSFKRNLTSVLEAVGPSTTAERCVK
jgi:viroplasmin and RNaseH domain-containing protein